MKATAVEAFERVKASAETKKRPEARQVGALGSTDYTRQGDIYIWSIPKVPAGARRLDHPSSSQIAPGETQGSRHCIADLSTVRVYELSSPNALQGPIIETDSGFTLTHPEHGHQSFGPGCYAITFQRAFADELRRARD